MLACSYNQETPKEDGTIRHTFSAVLSVLYLDRLLDAVGEDVKSMVFATAGSGGRGGRVCSFIGDLVFTLFIPFIFLSSFGGWGYLTKID